MNRNFLLFLYSRPNVIGLICGLVGLGLYVFNVIDRFWYLIVMGLYLIGVLIASFLSPRNANVKRRLRQQQSIDEIKTELDTLVRDIRRKVPRPVLEKVESIRASIMSVLPQIAEIEGDYNAHVIRQTALEYLPETLENYLNLPPAMASLHPLKGGKTAKQILLEQLTLLDQEMQQLVIDVHEQDSQKMLIHGRFLESKFSKGESFI